MLFSAGVDHNQGGAHQHCDLHGSRDEPAAAHRVPEPEAAEGAEERSECRAEERSERRAEERSERRAEERSEPEERVAGPPPTLPARSGSDLTPLQE